MLTPLGVSLAELLGAGMTLSSEEAVSVLAQLARSPHTGRPQPVPLDAGHVWLEPSGTVTLAPGILPRPAEFATLLDRLLPPTGDTVPRGLRSVIERVDGRGHAAAIPTLSAFATALAAFEPSDPRAVVSGLVARFGAASEPAQLLVPVAAVTSPPPVAAAMEPRVVPATVASNPVAAGWRPSTTHVAGAVAAALVAAFLGSTLAQRDDNSLPAARTTPVGSSAALREAPAEPEWDRTETTTDDRAEKTIDDPVATSDDQATATPPLTAGASTGPLATVPLEAAPLHIAPGSVGPLPGGSVPAEPVPTSPSLTATVPAVSVPTATVPAVTAPASASAATASTAAAPVAPASAAPASVTTDRPERPARLVDRRDARADAVYSPSFAPSGGAVFFHAESARGSALKRADANDGGELRIASIVDDGARNYHVQVSPDGSKVAFDSDRDGVRGVYVATADGRDVRRVSGPGYAAVPTWSPDGRRLAFIRAEPDRPAVWNLWLLDRASGQQARLTTFRRGQVWGGAWFADGRRLAYSHEDRITIHDLATGRSRNIPSPVPGRQVRTPAASPDGKWVVFQLYRDGVWLLDVESGAMRRILDDPSAEEFAWSPDGRRVAYHSGRSGGWNLWTMAVPTS